MRQVQIVWPYAIIPHQFLVIKRSITDQNLTTIVRMSLHGYPWLDINVDIHTCMDNWRLTSKNHGYPCWYPWIFENPCVDMLWILGPGSFSLKEKWKREGKVKLFVKGKLSSRNQSICHPSHANIIRAANADKPALSLDPKNNRAKY